MVRQATRDLENKARDLDRQAGDAYQQGDFHRALQLLDEARVTYPDMADVLTNHAIRAHQAQREVEARVSRPRDMGELDQPIPGYDDGLTERDPTPPEYDYFKEWFCQVHPDGDQMIYQDTYRAYQAGYHKRGEVSDREMAS
jgi:hypothetical protein